ncbi:MAG: sugar O-acyltransferase, sialic acid O-acetyltransferase NeuD family [Chitinophagaceae bacterium]|nr:sugar O-acyltransferase, sialic acid O-acetyltransferase NeuD family [Chitinophagaceae bacterium]
MGILIIIGAGGHGRVIKEVAIQLGFKEIYFIDEKFEGNGQLTWKGPINSETVILGIGNNKTRRQLAASNHYNFASVLIHPSAYVSPSAVLGEGSIVMPNCTIQTEAIIGKHVIINSSCSIDHHCKIGDFSHIAPNVTLCGSIVVGEGVLVGAGAVVAPNLSIGQNAIIGAGAVVIHNIPAYCTVVGNPAKIIKSRNE